MLEPPAPLSHLCPACKLWPCGERVCVYMCVCGWPDCYIHYSGFLNLLVIITCLLETVRGRLLVGLGKVVDLEETGVWLEVSQHSQSSVEVLSCPSEMDAKPHRYGSAGTNHRPLLLPPFLITVLQCNPIHKPKYMNIPVYSIICFLSMWSYGEDVDLTLYLGHRSLCMGRYAFAHNSV